ncbi:Bis(5'-nucleosyl)-tetraphosphatase, symmetrical [Candidatus Ecksteinia adelgidicola]|nr:Bis(5'-nucleosyl)-tetraphosphatase, symmetrical [Candidatus Ecksteinia adelgidicola]
MSTYIIGDIHGCFTELQLLLTQVSFNQKEDTLWLTGDLVSRGPHSLEVLRFVRSLGSSIRMVLGNHDLHLLAIHAGIRKNTPKDRITDLLKAQDIDELINWLRFQPMLQINNKLKLIMVHAGITPQWKIETAKSCANELEIVLRSNNYLSFLKTMYSDIPNYWISNLNGLARLRFIANALTRMRYCFPNGQLNMTYKSIPNFAPFSLKPWFNLPRLVKNKYTIVFGHWASLLGQGVPKGVIGLDTGCCWGNKLTMLRWEDHRFFTQSAKML